MLPFLIVAALTLSTDNSSNCVNMTQFESVEQAASIKKNDSDITTASEENVNNNMVEISVSEKTLAELNNNSENKTFYMVAGREKVKQLSLDEFDLLCRIVMAEAGGTSEITQRMVTETILNRMESKTFGGSLHDVIYAPGQFEPVDNGSINNVPTEQVITSVKTALITSECPRNLLYFNSIDYMWGKRYTKSDGLYFSTMDEK